MTLEFRMNKSMRSIHEKQVVEASIFIRFNQLLRLNTPIKN